MKHSKKLQNTLTKGFALISALSIMVLLVMITVGMLTLSTSEVRQSTQAIHQLEAQANARMALQIALGQLQQYVGQDQRVTATAAINENTLDEKKHLVGVWSTENWDPQNPNTKKFLTWLASVPTSNPPRLADSENALTPFDLPDSYLPGSKLITIVGEGSLGSGASADKQVQVATLPVIRNNKQAGSYAYWVADEATKASYSIPVQASPLEWNKATRSTTPYKSGLELMNEQTFDDYSDVAQTNKIDTPSIQTADLNHPSANRPSQEYFHDLSNRSVSIFTNTRHGGLKSDLSTAFELDLNDFNAISEFHNSSERNKTNNYDLLNNSGYNIPELYPETHPLGYLFEAPVNDTEDTEIIRGPTWDLLRNFYRLYKKEWEDLAWPRQLVASSDTNFVTRGSLPLSYATTKGDSKRHNNREYGIRSSPGGMYDSDATKFNSIAEPIRSENYTGNNVLLRQTSPRVAPSILRVTWVIGVRKQDSSSGGNSNSSYRLVFSFDPYVTIHNPYNRHIEFESIGMYCAKFNPLRFNIEWKKKNGTREKKGDLLFSNNTGTYGSYVFRLFPAPGETFTLKPGEIKVISPNSEEGVLREYHVYGQNQLIEGTFAYGEDTGLFLRLGKVWDNFWQPPNIQPAPNSSVKVTMYGRNKYAYDAEYGYTGFASNEMDTFNFSLLSTKNHDGTRNSLNNPAFLPPYMGVNHDMWDEDFLTRLTFSTFDNVVSSKAEDHELHVSRTFNVSSLPEVGESGFYIGALDIQMKHAGLGAPVFHQLNPTAQIYDPRNYDGEDRMGPAWDVTIKSITDVSDLQLVGDSQGHAYWGKGTDAANGTSYVVLKDLPRAPLTSLASLTHAEISTIPEDGTSHIGNSFLPAGFAATTQADKVITRRSCNEQYKINKVQYLTDHSWSANEALWDQYFFSGVNWGDNQLAFQQSATQTYNSHQAVVDALKTNTPNQPHILANARNQYIKTEGIDQTKLESNLKDYAKIGGHLACYGGFNVNSTSVEAWKAILGSLNDADIDYLQNGSLSTESSKNTPFTRYQLPAGSMNHNANSNSAWTGYRSLNQSEIETLAESMVEQVKLRGPFMGLADFVNRRLQPIPGTTADVNKLGAIQMAIADSGINSSLHLPVTTANVETKKINTGSTTVSLSSLTGAPGFLMQSDVLTSIGSILRTRSDTFTIRTYGESVDRNGKVQAKAWCEAVVQRTPEWYNPTTEAYKIPDPNYPDTTQRPILKKWINNPNVDQTNKKYGRKMQIISFRWLSPAEV